MRLFFFFLSWILAVGAANAVCDPTRFSHNCQIPFISKHDPRLSRVYCGDRLGHITREQYEILRRYQRADVNMILTINGEYVDSPCIPAGKRW